MEENKNICYPYAHGRLDSSLEFLATSLEMDCIDKDINIDERVLKMLAERIDKLRTVAVEESFEHSL